MHIPCQNSLPVTEHRGELQETFNAMKVSRDMRLSWLQRWQSMDTDGSKLLDYAEFVQACGLDDNMWSWRMFNLLDKNFVGTFRAHGFRLCMSGGVRR